MHGYTTNTRKTYTSSLLILILIAVITYYITASRKKDSVDEPWTLDDVNEHMLWNGGTVRW